MRTVSKHYDIAGTEPVFAGHFPTHPILPGVLLLSLASRAMSEEFGRPVGLLKIRRQRFSKPVLPGMRVGVEMALTPCEGGLEAKCRWVDAADGSALARADLVVEAAK